MKKSLLLIALLVVLPACNFVKVNGETGGRKIMSFADFGGSTALAASDNTETRDYEVDPFTGIGMNIAAELVYSVGAPSLKITAPDNFLEHLKIENEGGMLRITTDGTKLSAAKKIVVYASSATLDNLSVNGAVDFNAKEVVSGNFTAVINGAGDVDIEKISGNAVDITTSGAGDIELGTATCTTLSIKVNGAGDVDVENASCKFISLQVNGAGDCEIGGTADSAEVVLNGAGEVDVRKLKCDKISSTVHGAGRVRKN